MKGEHLSCVTWCDINYRSVKCKELSNINNLTSAQLESRYIQWGNEIQEDTDQKDKLFKEIINKSPVEIQNLFKHRLHVLNEKKINHRRHIPQWLLDKNLFYLYEEVDELYQMTPLLYMNESPKDKFQTFDKERKKFEENKPGEHAFHQTFVMVLGDWILQNHYVKSDKNSKKGSKLVDVVKEKLDLPKMEKCNQCGRQCVLFAWQLLALLHDIGYRVAFSYDLFRYFEGNHDGNGKYRKNYLEYIFPNFKRYLRFLAADIFDNLRNYFENESFGENWHKYVEQSKSSDKYSFFNHPIYGVYIIDNFIKKYRNMPDCFREIYKHVLKGIGIHHLPIQKDTLNVEFSWSFSENPLAYLLKVLDAIKIFNIRKESKSSDSDSTNGYGYNSWQNKAYTRINEDEFIVSRPEIRFTRGLFKIGINNKTKVKEPLKVEIPAEDYDALGEEVRETFKKDKVFPVEFEKIKPEGKK